MFASAFPPVRGCVSLELTIHHVASSNSKNEPDWRDHKEVHENEHHLRHHNADRIGG